MHSRHLIGSLLPILNNSPKFAQIYIYDTSNEVYNNLSQNPWVFTFYKLWWPHLIDEEIFMLLCYVYYQIYYILYLCVMFIIKYLIMFIIKYITSFIYVLCLLPNIWHPLSVSYLYYQIYDMLYLYTWSSLIIKKIGRAHVWTPVTR